MSRIRTLSWETDLVALINEASFSFLFGRERFGTEFRCIFEVESVTVVP